MKLLLLRRVCCSVTLMVTSSDALYVRIVMNRPRRYASQYPSYLVEIQH